MIFIAQAAMQRFNINQTSPARELPDHIVMGWIDIGHRKLETLTGNELTLLSR
jgi:hypothetical protein